jgi:diguanylate cyclase (GGDEF)-like protein
MKLFKSHKILIFYIVIILIGIFINLLAFCLYLSFEPDGLKLSAKDFTSNNDDLSYHLLDENDEKRMTFNASIKKEDLDLTGEGQYAVLFYQLNGQAFRVSLNGKDIGTVGDIESGNSNIWNSINYFYFDESSIREENSLSIELLSLYDRGLSSKPVYILKTSELNRYLGYADYFTEGINLTALGFTIFAFFIVFMLYLISSPKNSSFLYFSLALLFLGCYTFDFTTIYSLPFSYLFYKKLIFAALYMAVSMASMGMYKFFHRKADLILSVITISGYLIIFIFVRDMVTFKAIYNYYNLLITANLISWIQSSRKNFRKTDEAKMFFIGNILLLLCTFVDILIMISGQIFSLSTPFTYSFVFSMISIILFFREFVNKDHQLKMIHDAHKESYLASITDSMTGLYNHRYLSDLLKKTAPPYSVVMIDIDNFKEINDSFGHRFGDAMIRFVAHSLTSQVRSTDVVFRYGGDEFFIIFPKCSAEKAKEVIEKIQEKINENTLSYDGHIVPITFSGGVYYVSKFEDAESVFDKVDDPLYRSKKEGKNKITIFNIQESL